MSSADIMNLLTQSEIYEIKRRIASVLRDQLYLAEIRIILKKKPSFRSEDEIDKLIDKLKTIQFFQDKKLSYSEYRDLTQTIKYQELAEDDFVYKKGTVDHNFYLMLFG